MDALFLAAMAFVAGLVDSVVGGGGRIATASTSAAAAGGHDGGM